MRTYDVSIVVPSLRGTLFLKPLLDSLLEQERGELTFEVIVCNDSSSPFDLSAWKGRLNLKEILLQRHLGPSHARNEGVKAAKGELVAFLDDDVYADKDWLVQGYSCFQNEKIVAFAGKTIIPEVEKPSAFRHGMQNTGEGYPTCNFWVRKDAFQAVGGFSLKYFDPKTKIFHHEDSDLAYRLMEHGEVIYAENVLAFHPEHGFSWLMPLKKAKKSLFDLRLWQQHPKEYKKLTTHGPVPFARVIVRLAVVILSILAFASWFLAKPLPWFLLGCSLLLVLPIAFRYRLEKPFLLSAIWLPLAEWLACFVFCYYLIRGIAFLD